MKTFGAAALVWLAGAVWAGGQAPAKPVMAEEIFKNVQLLKGIPVDQFMGTMGFFSASLGLNCTDCHVDESGGNWAKYADDNALKQTTRRMIRMVAAINQTNFGGRQLVTCNTCHRGTRKPNVMPSLALLYGSPPPDEPGDPIVQAPGQPSPDQVLDKYVAALGGTSHLSNVSTIVASGTYKGYDDADKSALEMFAKSPAQRSTVVHTLSGNSTTTFDGHDGWIAAPETEKPVPLLAVTGQDLEGLKLEAELWFPARIKQALTKWRVGVRMTIDNHEVQPVQGTTATGATATLCFDVDSDLLVRLVRVSESPVGRLVSQIDYSDYREVSGIKMPFRWTVSWLDGRSVFELTDVRVNAPVPPGAFGKPARQ